MKTARRPTESSPTIGDDVLAELDERLSRLESRRRVVTAEIVALEKRLGTVGTINLDLPIEPSLDDLARRMLGGDLIPAAPSAPNDQRLVQLHKERRTIDRALELGRSHSGRMRIAASAETLAHGNEAWRANIRETALLAARLRRLGLDRIKIRNEIAAAIGGPTNLPFENYQLGRGPSVGDEFGRFLDIAKKTGVLTQKDIENA